MKYQLSVSTIHCIGRLNHVVGLVDNRDEAEAWVNGQKKNGLGLSAVLKEDPIVWCLVKQCHMKRQKPVLTYQGIKRDASIGIKEK